MMKILKRDFLFFVILFFISLIYFSSIFFPYDIWWDSAVYLGIGKYVYSSGNSGLFEASRPLVLPLVLGLFWKLGLDALLFGKIVAIMSSIGIIFLTYLISKRLFNEKVGLIAALLLAFFPAYFLFSNIFQTEILSAFFMIFGVYMFVKKKHGFSGFFLGIAFMTRFYQIFAATAILAILIFSYKNKKAEIMDIIRFLALFLLPMVPYIILSYYLYSSMLFPFYLQYWMSQNTGWIFNQSFVYYFISLFDENFLVIFSIIGLYYVFKTKGSKKNGKIKNAEKRGLIITIMFLFLFVPYLFIAHKEMRLIIPALPFLSILMGIGIFHFAGIFKKYQNFLLYLILIVFLVTGMPKLKFSSYEDNFDIFYEYVDNIDGNYGIWVSNPAFIAYSDKKADELVYYPLYGSERIAILEGKLKNADHILINTCEILPCNPNDIACDDKHNEFISKIKSGFITRLDIDKNGCKYYIFSRI